ncbi:hypothetical protein B9Z55_007545 [Caenorhabditis nigoni]|uniref:Uncharacterized protein n=1 Tax=Caenorhabditis nigoni TaxID=1611254 RepID=A0A2G5VA93_9PELO|nr:hypothetical protein B9Z55_007545 [Caenorhabditis nigoni]
MDLDDATYIATTHTVTINIFKLFLKFSIFSIIGCIPTDQSQRMERSRDQVTSYSPLRMTQFWKSADGSSMGATINYNCIQSSCPKNCHPILHMKKILIGNDMETYSTYRWYQKNPEEQ